MTREGISQLQMFVTYVEITNYKENVTHYRTANLSIDLKKKKKKKNYKIKITERRTRNNRANESGGRESRPSVREVSKIERNQTLRNDQGRNKAWR